MNTKIKTLVASCLICMIYTSCKDKSPPVPAVPEVLSQKVIDARDVFKLSRTGEKVTVEWLIDLSACKNIEIRRNTTGIIKDRIRVAVLDGNAKSFDDVVPDASHYWYWLLVTPPRGALRNIGPLRISPDTEGAGIYRDVSDTYKFSVTRTDAKATINWNFPNTSYQYITIKRGSNLKSNHRDLITTTLEWNNSIEDIYNDPNCDYWYWFEALLKDGRCIFQGPFKAEFQN